MDTDECWLCMRGLSAQGCELLGLAVQGSWVTRYAAFVARYSPDGASVLTAAEVEGIPNAVKYLASIYWASTTILTGAGGAKQGSAAAAASSDVACCYLPAAPGSLAALTRPPPLLCSWVWGHHSMDASGDSGVHAGAAAGHLLLWRAAELHRRPHPAGQQGGAQVSTLAPAASCDAATVL